jgi:5,10-methylenetetrahydrofolate reductase
MTLLTESRRGGTATVGCPKNMVYGPCQGVTATGLCEVDARECPFFSGEAVPFAAEVAENPATAATLRRALNPAAEELTRLLAERPIVLAEVPSDGPDPSAARAAFERLSQHVDGVVVGDAPWARLQLPPSLRALLATESGLIAIPGLNCRDRNRVALESELHALDAVGAPGVLCLTGDHTALGARPDALPVFDLDSTRLAALASRHTALVSVAERPADNWPHRLDRLRAKVAAGADLVFLNHAEIEATTEFIRQVKQTLPRLTVIASVPIVLSAAGSLRLAAFGGRTRDAGPADAAQRAHDHALDLLAAGADGIDLSAAAGEGETASALDALRDVGAGLRTAVSAASDR